ncbi:hypothetical protein AHAS_Ahas06G0102600 [Arachis hypogaea]
MSFTFLCILVHYVFNPALVEGSLADTITFEDFITLVNFGMDPSQNHKDSQKPRKFDNWCVFCRHKNLGNLPIIIIPAICKDKGSSFGDPDIGAVYIWSYVYNIMRVSIFRALSYIHRCIGVCHRDIKPQNLLIDTLTSDIANMNDVLLVKSTGLKKNQIWLEKRYVGSCHTSEWFNTTGRSIKTEFIASVIVSQVLLFGVIAIEIKRKAPHCNRNS